MRCFKFGREKDSPRPLLKLRLLLLADNSHQSPHSSIATMPFTIVLSSTKSRHFQKFRPPSSDEQGDSWMNEEIVRAYRYVVICIHSEPLGSSRRRLTVLGSLVASVDVAPPRRHRNAIAFPPRNPTRAITAASRLRTNRYCPPAVGLIHSGDCVEVRRR